ncbi:uncharacterized protein LOC128662837 [Bombina bombina]|uniref:uncharacterized protein LOC128662837 n=1 Tax=Bombina bombina TaxID=8345 RepID=UPI00235B0F31|nr:uncharacterized protein LOC128662837 [Bombina bombina]XP_053572802.1 uncharacterized protein LOC128662837 [Bombina bombina]
MERFLISHNMANRNKNADRRTKQGSDIGVQASSIDTMHDTHTLDPHPIVKQISTLFLPKIENLQKGVDTLAEEVKQFSTRVSEVETRVSDLEDTQHINCNKLVALEKYTTTLQQKIDDLENRSRRNNVRLIGLPENVKANDILKFVETTLPPLLEIPKDALLHSVERAHRVGPERPAMDRNSQPRPVMIKFLHFQTKMAVLRAYRKMDEVLFDNARILLFQDYSADLTKIRREFSALCSRLHREGKHAYLLYPAKLKIATSRDPKFFDSPQAAQEFLEGEAGSRSPSYARGERVKNRFCAGKNNEI